MFNSILEITEKDNTTTIINMKNISHIETYSRKREDSGKKDFHETEDFMEILHNMKNLGDGNLTIVMNDNKKYQFLTQNIDKAITSFSSEKVSFHSSK